jgi:hypothetical protein
MPLFSRITRYLRWPIYDARRRENEAWCFHCHDRRRMRHPQTAMQTNGRRRQYGRCTVCNYRMSKLAGGI